MPKNIEITIQNTKNVSQTIECIFEGNHQQDTCLFVGPWSIYRHTFSKETKQLFTFIGMDYYFSKSKYMASTEESMSLSRSELIWFYAQALSALKDNRKINQKIFILAPSALGFIALEYARFFPNQVKGVVLIGMPNSLDDIKKKQNLFFLNYSPLLFKTFSTAASSHDKWLTNLSNIKKYGPIVNSNTATDVNKYIAELKRDEEKYYTNMDDDGKTDRSLVQKMYKPWENINTDFRNYFFGNFMGDYNAKNIKKVTVPVIAIIGLYDGIAPPYLIPDMIEKAQLPKNFTYYIFNKSAHMPHYEESKKFAQVLGKWKEKINKSNDEACQYSEPRVKAAI